MPSECEIGIDPILECSRAELVEVRGGAGDRLSREVGQRRAAPESQRIGETLRGNGRFGAARVVDEPEKAVEVELTVGDTEQISRGPCDEPLAELPAQAAEMILQRRERSRRRCVPPDAGNEAIDRHDAVGIQEEQREHRPPPFAAERQHTLGVSYLQRAEDPELHRASLVPATKRA